MSVNNKQKRQWENLEGNLMRLKVPGGWLVERWMKVRVVDRCADGSAYEYEDDRKAGLTFVPDPQHEWDGSALE